MQHWTKQSELQMYIWQCFLEGEWKDVWKFLCPEASLKFYWAISPCQQFFSQPQWGWAPILRFSSLSALVTRPVSPLFRDFQFCWEEVWPQSGPLVTKTRHDQNYKKKLLLPPLLSLRIDCNQTAAFNQSHARKEQISPVFWWVFLPFLKQIKPSPFIPCYSCHQSDHLFTQRPLLLLVSVKNQVSGILEGNTLHRQLSLFVLALFLLTIIFFFLFQHHKMKICKVMVTEMHTTKQNIFANSDSLSKKEGDAS